MLVVKPEEAKELFKLLETYQDKFLSDSYSFEKYEDYYSAESCCDESLTEVDGVFHFTWTFVEDGESYYGLWFKIKKEELLKIA